MSRRSAFVVVAWCLAASASGCGGRSDEELRQELADFVAQSNACTQSSQCVAAFISCPLGCYAAVNQASKASVEGKAQELVQERGGGTTECDCLGMPAVSCASGHCTK